jgi:AmmeMemoRadiSam system protein A
MTIHSFFGGEMLSTEDKKELLRLARATIEDYVTKSMVHKYVCKPGPLCELAGAFVTLHKEGRLRGCIGMIESEEPLFETVIEMAIEATRDPRFEPVNEYELKDIDVEVSILFPKKRIFSIDDIELGKHGVMVKRGFAHGVFLPQVAKETSWTREEFMAHLCRDKAGLPADSYRQEGTEVFIFEAEVFGEKEG